MLLSTQGLEEYISGVIFHEETAKQITHGGVTFVEYVRSRGIIAGIKVDKGLGVLNNTK